MYCELISSALAVINEQMELIDSTGTLAEALGVSEEHLIRQFKKETGTTPGKYIEAARINRAKLILCNSDYNLETIAGMCGYSCSNYFCKVFRKATGQTPGEYRRNQLSYVDESTLSKFSELQSRFLL